MKPFFIKSKDSITVLMEGAPYTVAADHPRYEALGKAIDKANWGDVADIVRAKARIIEGARKFGEVVVAGGHITFRGQPMVNYLAERILEIQAEGLDPEPMAMFLDKVMQNPDPRAQRDLYRWCEAGGLPLTTDGEILAYKIVKFDWTDVHTGKMDNSVGAIVEQSRELCDPDPNQTCSHGLHFCSAGYLPRFGQYSSDRRVVLVKIHPADVVAFPTDYGLAKGRACKYLIAQEIDREKAHTFFSNFKGYYQVPTPAPAPEPPPVTVEVTEALFKVQDPSDDTFVKVQAGWPDDKDDWIWVDAEAEASHLTETDADTWVANYGIAMELIPVVPPEPMVFVQSPSGQYWKAPGDGATSNIAEAHPYPLSEVKGYASMRVVEAKVPEPPPPPAHAFEVLGFPVGSKVRVKEGIERFSIDHGTGVLEVTDYDAERTHVGFASGCVRIQNEQIGRGYWYPVSIFQHA